MVLLGSSLAKLYCYQVPTGEEPDTIDEQKRPATHPSHKPGVASRGLCGEYEYDHYLAKVHEWAANVYLTEWFVAGRRGAMVSRQRTSQTPTVRQLRDMTMNLGGVTASTATQAINTQAINAGAGLFNAMFPSVPALGQRSAWMTNLAGFSCCLGQDECRQGTVTGGLRAQPLSTSLQLTIRCIRNRLPRVLMRAGTNSTL